MQIYLRIYQDDGNGMSIRPKLGNNPVYEVEQNIQDGGYTGSCWVAGQVAKVVV